MASQVSSVPLVESSLAKSGLTTNWRSHFITVIKYSCYTAIAAGFIGLATSSASLEIAIGLIGGGSAVLVLNMLYNYFTSGSKVPSTPKATNAGSNEAKSEKERIPEISSPVSGTSIVEELAGYEKQYLDILDNFKKIYERGEIVSIEARNQFHLRSVKDAVNNFYDKAKWQNDYIKAELAYFQRRGKSKNNDITPCNHAFLKGITNALLNISKYPPAPYWNINPLKQGVLFNIQEVENCTQEMHKVFNGLFNFFKKQKQRNI